VTFDGDERSRENRVPEDPVGFIQDRVRRGQILLTSHVSMCRAGRFISRAVILAAVDTYRWYEGESGWRVCWWII
jgi:hypothetical protein